MTSTTVKEALMVVTTETRPAATAPPLGLARAISDLLGTDGHDLPIRIDCYDGGSLGPPDAATSLAVRSADAVRYILTAPGELGFARAYVAGTLDVDGDIFTALQLRDFFPGLHVSAKEWANLA